MDLGSTVAVCLAVWNGSLEISKYLGKWIFYERWNANAYYAGAQRAIPTNYCIIYETYRKKTLSREAFRVSYSCFVDIGTYTRRHVFKGDKNVVTNCFNI